MFPNNNMYVLYGIIILAIIIVLIVKLNISKGKKNNKTNKNNINNNKNASSSQTNKLNEESVTVENFENPTYQKYKETSVPVALKEGKKEEAIGNLDQCKIQCDAKDDCIGFTREKIADSATGKCYLISNVVNCHNEYKEPSEKYLLAPGMSDKMYYQPVDFADYDTYFKLDVTKVQKDSIQKCVRLNMTTGISPRKYPFSLLVMDENNNLLVMSKDKYVESKKEAGEDKFYSKYSIFTIVKGLSGKGVSFKVNKNNSDFYVVKKGEGENVVLEMEEDSLYFKQNASFVMDLEYAEDESHEFQEVKYVSIKHENKGIIFYWKINEVTQKVVLINKEKVTEDTEDIMFEFKYPLPFEEEKNPEMETENLEPMESPGESPEDDIDKGEMKSLSDELDKLELDIRESQHQQNLKLMNIMLDVNKFKLQDLSMSDYLTQCVRTSEEPPTYVDNQITGNNRSYLNKSKNNTNNNSNNSSNNSSNNNEYINTEINSLEPGI